MFQIIECVRARVCLIAPVRRSSESHTRNETSSVQKKSFVRRFQSCAGWPLLPIFFIVFSSRAKAPSEFAPGRPTSRTKNTQKTAILNKLKAKRSQKIDIESSFLRESYQEQAHKIFFVFLDFIKAFL